MTVNSKDRSVRGTASSFRIEGVSLDNRTVAKRKPTVEQEKQVAIHDLLEHNSFAPKGSPGGPYHLKLSLPENRLVLEILLENGEEHGRVVLSLTPFRRVLKDYRDLCEVYYASLGEAPTKLEAIDMGRRGLHDEGAHLLTERLDGKIQVDFETARRLFTLICALSLKG